MIYRRSFIARITAEQCRTILRIDLQYNFKGVVKSELNENHFQFKGLAYRTGSIWCSVFEQVVSIQLEENPNDNCTNILISTMPAYDTAHGAEWQNAMEQLVNIVWTDIFRAITNRYQAVEATAKPMIEGNQIDEVISQTAMEQEPIQANFQNTEVSSQQSKVAQNKKKWLIVAGVALAIVLVIVFIPQLTGGGHNGITVEQEEFVTDIRALNGNYIFPILALKVKNTSLSTKKVSVEANFYADGNLLGSGLARYVTLASGDETVIYVQSDKGYGFWTTHQYTYKITKWWIFNQ